MNLLRGLELKTKLQMLLVLMSTALTIIAIIGYMNISNMKKHLDDLYFGTLVPIAELNQVLHLYEHDLEGSFYRVKYDLVTPMEAAQTIEDGFKAINIKWSSYESHYKRDEELAYMKFASKKIKKTNNYFMTILKMYYNDENLRGLSLPILKENMDTVSSVISRLIKYEEDIAKHNRKMLLLTYEKTLYQILGVFIFSLFGSIYLLLLIFKSIQTNQDELEETTKKLKESSYTDSLTNLYNRRYFNIVYERESKRAIRLQHNLTFMMLDIDFFKQYNDTYGHLEGDTTLKTVSKVLKNTLKRPTDFVFRLGGEEFGVILTETNEKESQLVAQSICEHIVDQKIPHEKNLASDFVSISIGVIMTLPSQDFDAEALMQLADEKLYEAKEGGRNKFIYSQL
jgi:diguanylate cyclase (GGDEF)-like protein